MNWKSVSREKETPMTTKLYRQIRQEYWRMALVLLLAIGFSHVAMAGDSPDKSAESQIIIKSIDGKGITLGDSTMIHTKIEKYNSNTPRLGIYLETLDFETAYKMHYDYTYGVIITDVIDGSAAQKAGLLKDDILMEFDGHKVYYEDQLVRMVQSKHVGDRVDIRYFRDETVYKTNAVLQGKEQPAETTGKGKEEKPWRENTISGGSVNWIPYWYVPEETAPYDLIKKTGFQGVLKDPGFGEKGLLMHNILVQVGENGKWAFGFNFGWYSVDRNTSIMDTVNYSRHMKYKLRTYGFTAERRIALLRGVYLAPGAQLGWGSTRLIFSQTDGDFVWSQLNNKLGSPSTKYVELKRGYLVFQPKISLVVKLTDWLGIQGTAGYMMSYSYHPGWSANFVGEKFDVKKSPENSLNGVIFSIGPWFSFD